MTRVIYAGDDRVRLSQKVEYIFKKSDALVCVGGAWYKIWVKNCILRVCMMGFTV